MDRRSSTRSSSRRRVSSTQLYRFGNVGFDDFSTQVPRMIECLKIARSAARSDLSVLITGESGTGKNLLAQAIHNLSPRKDNAFVTVNTSALSESLLQSELFGHEKGAFTGAEKRRLGQFELAGGGTLVLDEIADMSLQAQPKILHAVEYKQFQRLGGEELIHADVRLIAITNHNLDELAAGNGFRPELLYRLRELVIELPPLRERQDDIPFLCDSIAEQYRKQQDPPLGVITDAAMDRLMRYAWPGNIRELKSVIRRAAVIAEGQPVRPEHLGLPESDDVGEEMPAASEGEEDYSLEAAERRQILRVLRVADGNKRQTARMLGISRSTLDRKLGAYEIG